MRENICKQQWQQGVNIQNILKNTTKTSIKKWAEDLNRHPSQEDMQMTQIYAKMLNFTSD